MTRRTSDFSAASEHVSRRGFLGAAAAGAAAAGFAEDMTVLDVLKNPVIAAEYMGEQKASLFGSYASLTPEAASAEGEAGDAIAAASRTGKADALAAVSALPIFMLLSYLGLMMYYRGRGGYKPVQLDAAT